MDTVPSALVPVATGDTATARVGAGLLTPATKGVHHDIHNEPFESRAIRLEGNYHPSTGKHIPESEAAGIGENTPAPVALNPMLDKGAAEEVKRGGNARDKNK